MKLPESLVNELTELYHACKKDPVLLTVLTETSLCMAAYLHEDKIAAAKCEAELNDLFDLLDETPDASETEEAP